MSPHVVKEADWYCYVAFSLILHFLAGKNFKLLSRILEYVLNQRQLFLGLGLVSGLDSVQTNY